ncbi:hypothetical protein BMS3Bbin01_03051 [bacterium BMS3Bbin01]|nr:hypothetical protein BMS3Bbin01_03051 [bacterium BMS3Bbin01]
MRSSIGKYPDNTLSVVVFPEPVPPLMIMFRRPLTHASMKRATRSLIVPKPIRSASVYGSTANFRIVRNGPPIARG